MEEKVKQQYDRWLSQPGMPADLADELKSIAGGEDAITDRFYRELEFGTGGLRGVIGAGTNRMNVYNIRKATQGLANYLNASDLPKKVAIGYDSRIKSDVFAKETAAVLAANGIKAYIYPRLEPTPALSWAVRYYGCGAISGRGLVVSRQSKLKLFLAAFLRLTSSRSMDLPSAVSPSSSPTASPTASSAARTAALSSSAFSASIMRT